MKKIIKAVFAIVAIVITNVAFTPAGNGVKIKSSDVKWTGKGLNEKLVLKKNNQVIIKISPKFFRPSEVNVLIGDSSKASSKLNWKARTNLDELIKIMIDEELKYFNEN